MYDEPICSEPVNDELFNGQAVPQNPAQTGCVASSGSALVSQCAWNMHSLIKSGKLKIEKEVPVP